MKRRTERRMTLVLGVLLGSQVVCVIVFFCLPRGYTDLFADGTLKLETRPAPGTSLPHAHATQDSQSLRVSGRLRREYNEAPDQHGQVTLTVLSAEGLRLDELVRDYTLSTRAPKGGGRFDVRFQTIPPAGSTIVVSWQEATGDKRSTAEARVP